MVRRLVTLDQSRVFLRVHKFVPPKPSSREFLVKAPFGGYQIFHCMDVSDFFQPDGYRRRLCLLPEQWNAFLSGRDQQGQNGPPISFTWYVVVVQGEESWIVWYGSISEFLNYTIYFIPVMLQKPARLEDVEHRANLLSTSPAKV